MQELVHHSEAMLCSRRTKGRLTPCIKSSNLEGDSLGTQGRTGEFLCKKSLFYGEDVSLLHSQGHAASTMRKGRRGQRKGGGEEGIEERDTTCQF